MEAKQRAEADVQQQVPAWRRRKHLCASSGAVQPEHRVGTTEANTVEYSECGRIRSTEGVSSRGRAACDYGLRF